MSDDTNQCLGESKQCVDELEQMEIVDLGDFVEQTRQLSPVSAYVDSSFAVGWPG